MNINPNTQVLAFKDRVWRERAALIKDDQPLSGHEVLVGTDLHKTLIADGTGLKDALYHDRRTVFGLAIREDVTLAPFEIVVRPVSPR